MAVESLKVRAPYLGNNMEMRQLYALLVSVQETVAQIQTQLNTHVHSGVTAGGANSGAPTTTLTSVNFNA